MNARVTLILILLGTCMVPARASESRRAVLPFSFVPKKDSKPVYSEALKAEGRKECAKGLKAKDFAALVRRLAVDGKPEGTWLLTVKLSGDKEANDYRLNLKGLLKTVADNPAALARKPWMRLKGTHHELFFRAGKCRWYVPTFPEQQSGEVDLMEVTRGEFLELVQALNRPEKPVWPARHSYFKGSASPGRGQSQRWLRGRLRRDRKESSPQASEYKASDFSPSREPDF